MILATGYILLFHLKIYMLVPIVGNTKPSFNLLNFTVPFKL